MNPARLLVSLVLIHLSVHVAADELRDAVQGLCDSVRSCALEQIVKEELTPEMRDMMEPMLDNMCATMKENVQEVAPGHPLYDPAVACIRSLESLTCDEMQNPGRDSTPECEIYEKLASEQSASPGK